MAILRRGILHPFAFALFPVLTLLAHNLTQVKVLVGMRALLVALVLATVVLLGLRRLLGDWQKAALIASLFLVLFFSYGHVYSTFKQTTVSGFILGRHRLLTPLWGGLFILGVWTITRRLKDLTPATEALNFIGIVAVAFPLFQFAAFQYKTFTPDPNPNPAPAEISGLRVPPGETAPDIYHIVLDAYTRADVLKAFFGYDNSPFLDELTALGFYVAECSQSNYTQTELSLSSTLNFNYLEALGDNFISGSDDRSDLWGLIRDNNVRRALKELGYTVVAFETGYYWTQLEDADIYYSPSTSTLDALEVVGGVNSFEALLIDTTASLLLTDAASVLPAYLADAVEYPHQRHRERVLYDLNKLKSIPLEIQSPKYVFAHIVTPHEPYVFGPDGEFIQNPKPMDDQRYNDAYRDQVIYINGRIITLVRDILATSRTPPIIIIHGDHGAGRVSAQDKMAILNAYYLPGGGGERLYPAISPVNTYRVIFEAYFDGEFQLLDDRSYFSTYDDPYNYRDIPISGPGCGS
jgi:hypothetical protein